MRRITDVKKLLSCTSMAGYFISYVFFRLTVGIFRILPFRVLYVLSDFLAFFLRRVAKYRLEVTRTNLRRCFPNASEEKMQMLIKGSYLNLSDILLESIKGMSISRRTLQKRFRFANLSLLDNAIAEGRSLILLLGHVCNWEWGAISLGLNIRQNCVGVYKQINNPYIEKFTRKRRARTGLILAHTKETGQVLKSLSGEPTVFILIADQNPSNPSRSYWVSFMGEKTAFHHGPASISKAFDFSLYYLSVRRIRRGYYLVDAEDFLMDPNTLDSQDIIQRYANRLEEQIQLQPEDWLWSHKRWKHKWENYQNTAE